MIKLFTLSFRWFAAAGALGFAGLGEGHDLLRQLRRRWAWYRDYLQHYRFAFVTKSLTLEPRQGNFSIVRPWRSIRTHDTFAGRGLVNAVALTNPGLDVWIKKYYPLVRERGIATVVSIAPSTPGEAQTMVRKLYQKCHIQALEWNASCPNHPADPSIDHKIAIANALGGYFPVIMKLAFDDDAVTLASEFKPAAVALINAVPWPKAQTLGLVNGPSPLEKYGYHGSLSGPLIAQLAVDSAIAFRRAVPGVPIISIGGVDSADEAAKRFRVADAVGAWTLIDRDPAAFNRIIREVDGA
jgi:dihydroorotate dehydrogenase (NAD+) catalytic subunit